jgi:hypothetical protein
VKNLERSGRAADHKGEPRPLSIGILLGALAFFSADGRCATWGASTASVLGSAGRRILYGDYQGHKAGQHVDVRLTAEDLGAKERLLGPGGQSRRPARAGGRGVGVVPLMAMIRHRVAVKSEAPTRMLYSSLSYEEIICLEEPLQLLARRRPVEVVHTRPAPGLRVRTAMTGASTLRCWRR